jgi:predicted unusual protein kinase regulating ubiquinone biosynthesis (AarF/ABC1/UbiB family)
VDEVIGADLDAAQGLYGAVLAVVLPGVDVDALVAELRARMADELDYRVEGRQQAAFAERWAGHPFVHVPQVRKRAGRCSTSLRDPWT